jgi:F0F1-type ATP synthase assembly protein I
LKEKKENTLKYLFSVLLDSLTIGIAVASSIVIAALVGWWIEGKIEKIFKIEVSPWITTIFIIFGVIGGFKNLIYFSKKRLREVEGKKRTGE